MALVCFLSMPITKKSWDAFPFKSCFSLYCFIMTDIMTFFIFLNLYRVQYQKLLPLFLGSPFPPQPENANFLALSLPHNLVAETATMFKLFTILPIFLPTKTPHNFQSTYFTNWCYRPGPMIESEPGFWKSYIYGACNQITFISSKKLEGSSLSSMSLSECCNRYFPAQWDLNFLPNLLSNVSFHRWRIENGFPALQREPLFCLLEILTSEFCANNYI